MSDPHTGSYVMWPGGHGRVDLIVAHGAVPGVAGALAADGGTLARVDVWEGDATGWHPTEVKAVVPLGDLVEIPPLDTARHGQREAQDRLVALVAAHDQIATHLHLPDWSRPPGVAVKAVFERGRAAWPGGQLTALTADEWALARVEAFLALASGVEVQGYRRDVDLLPLNHPARAATAPS